MKPQLFLDLDGVLADFDTHYRDLFGEWHEHDGKEPEKWNNVRNYKTFFLDMPLMSDAMELWEGSRKYHPIILTGVPYSIPNVAAQKRLWVTRHFGLGVQMIACRSADKKIHGLPGDILVDDRLKYAHLWTEMGGVFIHHISAANTLQLLGRLPL